MLSLLGDLFEMAKDLLYFWVFGLVFGFFIGYFLSLVPIILLFVLGVIFTVIITRGPHIAESGVGPFLISVVVISGLISMIITSVIVGTIPLGHITTGLVSEAYRSFSWSWFFRQR